MLVGDRQGDRARARAEIEHARLRLVVQEREAALDEHLGLGTWDERPCVCLECQSAKAPLAEHVRERLAPAAAVEQFLEHLRNLPIASRVHARPRGAEHVRDEELGVDIGRVDARFRQPLGGETQRCRGGHSPRARRRSSAPSASVKSSSSPWSARSSWCVVSLMRWSVTRFSGKL